ncbi:MAG: protein translocase subunit SecF, partial [Myxococcota bacterium]|nr:protein translocase subunit SecF [Myxococcota bacterium]
DETSQVTVQDFDVGVTGEEETVPAKRYLVYTEVPSLVTTEQRGQIATKLKGQFGEKTRVDVPEDSSDTFYITFPKGVVVTERYAALQETFKGLGFEQVTIASDYERQLDVEWFKDLNLLVEEKKDAAGAEDDTTDELMLSQAAWNKKKAKMLEGKTDTRFTVSVEELRAKVRSKLADTFGPAFVRAESSTSVSASVGADLLNNGLLAVLYAIIGILIYITLRFDFRFAPGAVVALVHDVFITLGIFSAFQVKFSLPIIAALLTIVGYSLNDTIVVLDRVRETFSTYRGRDIKGLLNRAINETLSRTVLTSVTTAFVVASILVLGGGLIRDFALALMIGIIVGTYSSIFVACPLVHFMDQYLSRRESAKLREARGSEANAAKA